MNTPRNSHHTSAVSITFKRFLFTVMLVVLVQISAFAQNDAHTPLGLTPGTPSGTYALTDIDTVNLFNGQVNIRVPLLNRNGRRHAAGLHYTFDSPARYQVYKSTDTNGNPIWGVGGGTNHIDGSSSSGLHTGEYNVFPVGVQGGGGSANWCSEGLYVWSGTTLTRFYWSEPDGTQHEMRDVLTNGQPLTNGGCWSTGPHRGRIFVSTDGSGATFIADDPVYDGHYVGMEYPHLQGDWDGWLLLKDGRRIRISQDSNRGIRDKNGNLMLFNPGVPYPIVDDLGRTIASGAGTANECSALKPGVTTCGYWSYKGFGGAERRIYRFAETDGISFYLPNGTFYRVYMNFYGDVTRIDLPSGGSIEYDYGPGLTGPQPDMSIISGAMPGTYWGGPTDAHVYRRVTERRVYKEGHVLDSRQTFSKPEDVYLNNAGYVDKANYDGSGNLLSTERHYFYGSAEGSFLLETTQYSSWKSGREYRTEIYNSSGNLLRTVDTYWEQRAPVSWWTGNPDDAPPNDPRVSGTRTLLENGAQFTNSYGYDPNVPYNSLIDVIERDYNLNILRRKQTTYLKTLNGVDYAGLNVQAATALHIRDLPLEETIIGANNVAEARTTYEYDNYTTVNNHAELAPRPNIVGHDSSFDTNYTKRGNVTAITRHLLTNGTSTGSVTSYLQYDVAGNVVKTIDPRGNATLLDFTDRFGLPDGFAQSNSSPTELSSIGKSAYAFATRVTNALNHVTHSQIDFYTGQVVDAEAANGIVSSAYFNDSLDRPKQVITASSNSTLKTQTTFNYDDLNRVVTTTSDLSIYGDNLKKTEERFDGLGRNIETRLYESSSAYIVTQSTYAGLTSQRSNPYRPGLGETAQWTTSVVDALGRMKTVTTPDNAVVTTAYTGNTVTVTDPAGKKRKSVSDSLGRITEVYEDPNGLNYKTVYGYNSLNNLISVAQDALSQAPRAFVYDSLGRLTSITTPETENRTTTYKYDEGGNLVVKTDPRGVSTHYSYDAINRPTRTWYNGSSSTSRTIHNDPQHPIPSGVGATDEANYFYDAQSLPGGAPSFDRGPSTGSLVAMTYGTNSSTGDYFGRDAIGRPSIKIQRTGGVNYVMSLTYNPVGAVSSLIYGSGNTVSYAYDGAGRLSSMAGDLGDLPGRVYASGISYSRFGGPEKEQFGTNTAVYHKRHYNVRGQLFDVRISNVNNEWDGELGVVANYYSANGQHGGSGTDNNGNVLKSQTIINSFSVEDRYTYDALNRLASVSEYQNGTTPVGTQTYSYDRWGNRTIQAGSTLGTYTNFGVNPAYNRLTVPSGQSGTMTYDAAGNLTNDTYTGQGIRTYDGNNKITTAWGGNNQAQVYSYDASGERIKRTVDGVETWQVYGFGGELLAEYPANGAANSPLKEYGYRNGELLVSASPAVSSNHSLSVNSSSGYVQVPNSSSLNITGSITVEAWLKPNSIGSYQYIVSRETFGVAGTGGGYELTLNNIGKARFDLYHSHNTYTPVIGNTVLTTGAWHHIAGVWNGTQLRLYVDGVLDATVATSNGPASGTSSVKLGRNSGGNYFNGLIDEVRVSNTAVYASNFTPQTNLSTSPNTKGLWKFNGQTAADASTNGNNGSLQGGAGYSADVPTGPAYHSLSVNGSNAYVQVPNSSSLNITGSITVEAWLKPNSIGSYQYIVSRETFGVAGTGGGYELTLNNVGKARFDVYHSHNTYTPVIGNTVLTTGAWHHIAGVWNGTHLRLYVNGVLDATVATSNGPASGTSSVKLGRNSGGNYFNGLIDEVRVSNTAVYTSNFTPQTHLSTTANTQGLWKFDGQTVTDSSTNANNGTLQGGATHSNDVPSGDGGGGGGGGTSAQTLWFVSDHLGTPRMLVDETGTLENIQRHDYLPFGEELPVNVGGRSATLGYGPDETRQRFTQMERDSETGLDYFAARYYSSTTGRFTSIDPLIASGRAALPQSWNRYAYGLNNPLKFVDPTGLLAEDVQEFTITNPCEYGTAGCYPVQLATVTVVAGPDEQQLTTTSLDPSTVSVSERPLQGTESEAGGGLGWGVTISGSAAAGLAFAGAGGTGSLFGGFFSDEFGNVTQGVGASGGVHAGVVGETGTFSFPAFAEEDRGRFNSVVGFGAGIGAGLFFTNAKRVEELSGPFWTRMLSTPWGTIQYDRSGNVGVLSVTFGPSVKAFYWSGPTSTATSPSMPSSPTLLVPR